MAPSNLSLSVIIEPPIQPGTSTTQSTSPIPSIIVVVILAVLLLTVVVLLSVALVRSRHRSRYGVEEDGSASNGTTSPTESKVQTLVSLSPKLWQNTFVLKLPISNPASPIKVYCRSPLSLALLLNRCLSRRNKICKQASEIGSRDENLEEECEKVEETIIKDVIILPSICVTDVDEDSGTRPSSDRILNEREPLQGAALANKAVTLRQAIDSSLLSPIWTPRDAPVSVLVNVTWRPGQTIEAEISTSMTLEFFEIILQDMTGYKVELLALIFNGDKWSPYPLKSTEDLQALIQPLRSEFLVEIDAYIKAQEYI